MVSLLISLMLYSLTACGKITHCKDCDGEIYEDGYCKYHQALHCVDEMTKDAFDMIFRSEMAIT